MIKLEEVHMMESDYEVLEAYLVKTVYVSKDKHIT